MTIPCRGDFEDDTDPDGHDHGLHQDFLPWRRGVLDKKHGQVRGNIGRMHP